VSAFILFISHDKLIGFHESKAIKKMLREREKNTLVLKNEFKFIEKANQYEMFSYIRYDTAFFLLKWTAAV